MLQIQRSFSIAVAHKEEYFLSTLKLVYGQEWKKVFALEQPFPLDRYFPVKIPAARSLVQSVLKSELNCRFWTSTCSHRATFKESTKKVSMT